MRMEIQYQKTTKKMVKHFNNNIAIVGASYLQLPLIKKAKDMGFETHVFAWKTGAEGETEADHFYPISITEKEEILKKCKEIGICGICSIASDLAVITVNYVAQNLGLVSNSIETTKNTTNKAEMRSIFEMNHDPSPKYVIVQEEKDLAGINLQYPLIVKPSDRSGSRGVSKVVNEDALMAAFIKAKEAGFSSRIVIEEYIEGTEYSVESISNNGVHTILAITEKFTTGSPFFIEIGHVEPAVFKEEGIKKEIESVVIHALDSLGIKYGASHTELKINGNQIKIVEVGARMGGDLIGSSLVPISTGIDFVKAVIQVSVGDEPDITPQSNKMSAGIRYIIDKNDVEIFEKLCEEHPESIVEARVEKEFENEVTDSSNRHGYFLVKSKNRDELMSLLCF